MRLDLEHAGPPVAQVDHPSVLARADQDLRSVGGESSKVHLRGLVGTVLGPHGRVHGELGAVRLPFQSLPDALELLIGEAERPVELLLRHAVTRTPAPARASSHSNTAC